MYFEGFYEKPHGRTREALFTMPKTFKNSVEKLWMKSLSMGLIKNKIVARSVESYEMRASENVALRLRK